MSARVKVIFNPHADLGRAARLEAGLRSAVQGYGEIAWSNTLYHDHAVELARRSAEEGDGLLIAMGGDGTVNEVINGLLQVEAEKRPVLGVVPVGSGNDFSYSLGISADPLAALRQAFEGQAGAIDVGLVRDNLGRQIYWGNVIGIGFDAVVNIRSRRFRLLRGFFIYFAAVLQTILLNHNPYPMHVKIDGREFEDRLMMLILSNGKREGGGFMIAPQARQDDGLLDYVGVQEISRLQMLRTIPYFLKGTQHGLPYVLSGNFTHLELSADRPLHIHTDGEIYAGFDSQVNRLTVERIASAIQVMR